VEVLNESNQEQNKQLVSTLDTFNELESEVAKITQASNNIAGQLNSLVNIKNSIVSATESLAAISEENAASTQETTASIQEVTSLVTSCTGDVENLKQLSLDLEEQISIFKL